MVSMRRAPGPIQASRRGAAAVELALITPLLVTVMLGCIDFGRFPSTAIAVRNAARVGAEYASNHLPDPNEAAMAYWRAQTRSVVEAEMSGFFNIDPADPDLKKRQALQELLKDLEVSEPTRTDLGDGRYGIQVDVVYPFRTLIPWNFHWLDIDLGLPHQIDIQQTVVMEENKALYVRYTP
jgi:hypothetical protein